MNTFVEMPSENSTVSGWASCELGNAMYGIQSLTGEIFNVTTWQLLNCCPSKTFTWVTSPSREQSNKSLHWSCLAFTTRVACTTPAWPPPIQVLQNDYHTPKTSARGHCGDVIKRRVLFARNDRIKSFITAGSLTPTNLWLRRGSDWRVLYWSLPRAPCWQWQNKIQSGKWNEISRHKVALCNQCTLYCQAVTKQGPSM